MFYSTSQLIREKNIVKINISSSRQYLIIGNCINASNVDCCILSLFVNNSIYSNWFVDSL